MAASKPVAMRFTPTDLALVEAIMAKTGINNRTDVVRLAIRRLAEAEGVHAKPPTTKKRN